VAGVGIPDYLIGRFKILLDGKFESIRLYITKTEKNVFIYLKNGKIYGLSPQEPDKFIEILKNEGKFQMISSIDTMKPLEQPLDISAKYRKKSFILFNFSIILCIIIVAVFIFYYFQLPNENIPLHWNASNLPDKFGSKIELIWNLVFIISFGEGLPLLFYYLIIKKSEFGKSKIGIYLMLLPLIILIIFLILQVIIFNQTIEYLNSS